jgi:hypothetical protein
MPQTTYEVRLLTQKDHKRFQKFRDLCSQKAAPSLIKAGITRVRELDFIYPNLLLLKNGRIEASLRMEFLASWKDFDLRYQTRGSLAGRVKFPCLYTTQAYTRPSSRQRGYNTFLRLIAIEMAKHWKARSLLSDMVAKSPRRQTMLEMGYRAYPHPTGWPDMKVYQKISSMLLNLEKKGPQALKVSRALTKELRRQTKISSSVRQAKVPKARLDLLIFYESLR